MILFASTAVADKNASLNTKADGSTKGEEMKPNGPLNLEWKTGGGMQFWTDHLYRQGYRIPAKRGYRALATARC